MRDILEESPLSKPKLIRKVKRSDLETEPYLIWNSFIDLIALTDYEDLSEIQRVAHLAFLYESEVQNGGHLQYFENQGVARIDETLAALETLGADCHRKVLQAASEHIDSNPRDKILTVEEYISRASEGEYNKYDAAYGECRPEMNEYLEAYLQANLNEFVELE
jgi:hypothetical protein